jgi:multifunctional 2-oxoglutarate metabolism enzyme
VPACISAVRLAFAFRQEFGHDVVIDLIGYRRYGHNEADEPAYTQPEMAAKIKKKISVREIYASQLVERGVLTKDEADALAQEIWNGLSERHRELKEELSATDAEQPTGGYELDRSPSPEVKTAVSTERLKTLNEELLKTPDGFTVHPKLLKQLERRREAVGSEGGIDWAQAESLAYASLLTEGTPVRLTGQDVERGTFSQRHLVLHDAKTGQRVSPIQSLAGALAPMELHNSPLSEIACMGFEYGYSMEAPETLVLWEAQFGDFVNSAQVIVDQFIVSGLSKWQQSSRLTLLLPHGYEGSGPEHSSARLERFMQMAAQENVRIVNCTTAAQYFHVLRRQALHPKPRPLVLLTPKGRLRLPQATSHLDQLAKGSFRPILDDPNLDEDARRRTGRLILCSGKVYYDIVGHDGHEPSEGIAVARLEQLYPFPLAAYDELLSRYPNVTEVVWAQEEPQNMGAWRAIRHRLEEGLPAEVELRYVGRPWRASPSEGYPTAHVLEQDRIARECLESYE